MGRRNCEGLNRHKLAANPRFELCAMIDNKARSSSNESKSTVWRGNAWNTTLATEYRPVVGAGSNEIPNGVGLLEKPMLRISIRPSGLPLQCEFNVPLSVRSHIQSQFAKRLETVSADHERQKNDEQTIVMRQRTTFNGRLTPPRYDLSSSLL